MALNLITAVILFITTIILGYTILYVLFGHRLRERRAEALARMEQEGEGKRTDGTAPHAPDGETVYGSYTHPAINDDMGFEFIRVIHPDIVGGPSTATQAEKSFADSQGKGVQTVQAESRETDEPDDDGGYRYNLDGTDRPEDAAFLDPADDAAFYDFSVMTFDAEEHVRELRDDTEMMEREVAMADEALEYVRSRDFAMPDGEGEMNDYQKGILNMEDGRGENAISSREIEMIIREARKQEELEEEVVNP